MPLENKNPLVGDLISLHSPPGDEEIVDLGIVTAIHPKRTAYGDPICYATYTVLGLRGDRCEYDEPFWEARVVNRAK
jgi:hypothetical protein